MTLNVYHGYPYCLLTVKHDVEKKSFNSYTVEPALNTTCLLDHLTIKPPFL